MLLILIILISANAYMAVKTNKRIGLYVVQSVIIYVAWFAMAFMCVAQLHISLGGHMCVESF